MQELTTEEEDGDFSPDKGCVVCGRGIRDTRDTVTSPRDTSHVTPSIAADPRRRPTLSQQTNNQPEVRWGGVDALCSVGRESQITIRYVNTHTVHILHKNGTVQRSSFLKYIQIRCVDANANV